MKYCLFVVFVLFGSKVLGQSDTVRYTVYYFLGEDCKICEYYTPEINRLDSLFSSEEIEFKGLFPSRYSTKKGIEEFRTNYKVTIPLKLEYFATKTKAFGVTITPEVVIYDNTKKKMLYRGRIDDSYVRVGKRRRIIQKRDLESILLQLKEGKEVAYVESAAIGCYITFR